MICCQGPAKDQRRANDPVRLGIGCPECLLDDLGKQTEIEPQGLHRFGRLSLVPVMVVNEKQPRDQ